MHKAGLWVCDYFHLPFWQTWWWSTHLEACRSWFARRYISLIVDFKIRHHSYNSFDDKSDDVRPHLLDVHTFGCQPVQHAGQSALAACVLAVWMDKIATVDIEGVVCQVHKHMTQILLARLLNSQNRRNLYFLHLYARKYECMCTISTVIATWYASVQKRVRPSLAM